MKTYAVNVAGYNYHFVNEITARHFIKRCRRAEKAIVQEIVIHQPSMIDDLVDRIDSYDFI